MSKKGRKFFFQEKIRVNRQLPPWMTPTLVTPLVLCAMGTGIPIDLAIGWMWHTGTVINPHRLNGNRGVA